jgi:hypothetical protein
MNFMNKYNLRLIKLRRSYNITEMASLLGVNRKTCQRWIQVGGLRVIEKNVNPLLVMGADLYSFLKEMRDKRRFALGEDEFFCMKCHKSVKAKMGSERLVKTGKKIGKNGLEQFKKIGVCEVCGTELNRYLRGQKED